MKWLRLAVSEEPDCDCGQAVEALEQRSRQAHGEPYHTVPRCPWEECPHPRCVSDREAFSHSQSDGGTGMSASEQWAALREKGSVGTQRWHQGQWFRDDLRDVDWAIMGLAVNHFGALLKALERWRDPAWRVEQRTHGTSAGDVIASEIDTLLTNIQKELEVQG